MRRVHLPASTIAWPSRKEDASMRTLLLPALVAALCLPACRQEHPADPARDNPAPTAEAHQPEADARYATGAQETRVGEDPEADEQRPRAQR